MRNSALSSTLNSLQMTEVILCRHGNGGPSTFRCNNTNTPIDGIWTSSGIRVKQCGYLPYDHILPGADHHCLWLDITYKNAFGHNMPAVPCPNTRRLHCRDPQIVQRYIEIYETLAKSHNLQERVRLLEEKARYPLSPALATEYKKLDNIRCTITCQAEKQCRKLRKGQVDFSPELQQASRQIAAWSLMRKKALGKKVSSRLISRSLKKANLSPSIHSFSKEQIKAALKTAFTTYYTVKNNHRDHRLSHLESLAKALSQEKNVKKLTILCQLQEREQQRAVAKKISTGLAALLWSQ